MKKILPYIYIAIGTLVIISTVHSILQNKESYRVLFNFYTESKFLFLMARGLFASWFLFDGIKKLKEIG